MSTPWLKVFQKNSSASLRLFCFHYAGGSASAFADWHKYLPDFAEVVCVQLPGREQRFSEPLITNIDEIIVSLKESISSHLTLPFVFFGHSLGAYIAYCLLSELDNQYGSLAKHFIASGRQAPWDSAPTESVADLADDLLIKKIQRFGGTPQFLIENKELMDIYLPILRADFTISESRQSPKNIPSCSLSAFGGHSDSISEQRLQLWAQGTKNAFSLHMFSGGHFFINDCKAEVLKILAAIINRYASRQNSDFP